MLAQNGGGRRRRSRPRCPAALVQAYSPRLQTAAVARMGLRYVSLPRSVYSVPRRRKGSEQGWKRGAASARIAVWVRHRLTPENTHYRFSSGAQSQLCFPRGDPFGCRDHTGCGGKISARAGKKSLQTRSARRISRRLEPPVGLNTTRQGYFVAHHYYMVPVMYISRFVALTGFVV